ncbi:MAG: hypothetical protein AAGJ46_15475 [Planctomycetota bacterium]
MSAFLPRDQVEPGGYCVLLDETSVVNLSVVSVMLGLSEESTKKWCVKYGVRRMPGRTWVTNGRQIFQAMERHFEESERGNEAG